VTAAVERYLSNRGIGTGAAKPVADRPAAPAATAAVIPNVSAQVVDRFLARRGVSPNPGPPAKPPATCGVKSEANATCHSCTAAAAEPPPAKPAEQPIAIVDFVCEEDVRTAMKQSRKIFIGPKTIVTPSARELAGDILVLAQR